MKFTLPLAVTALVAAIRVVAQTCGGSLQCCSDVGEPGANPAIAGALKILNAEDLALTSAYTSFGLTCVSSSQITTCSGISACCTGPLDLESVVSLGCTPISS
ncbi:unnamed protein product [Peniophora sp. CBMAI 1063]|nr:unnamed protein product [Peniophora sp. CBMAI 1063]